MNIRTWTIAAIVSLLTTFASAEDARTVTGSGKVVVKQMPTTMRMSIQVRESGKDVADALKSLKERRDAATATLVKLGAQKESIREGAPSIQGDDPRTAQMMAMRHGPGGGGTRKQKTGAVKVTLTGRLTAEWPLPEGKIEDSLKVALGVKDKLAMADLAGQKPKKKLTPEEQEEVEEMELLQQEYGQQPEAKFGEPAYLFLARISPDDAQQARAASFQKACKEADQLVTAAGHKLGKLRSLQSHGGLNNELLNYGAYGGQGGQDAGEIDDTDDEAIGKSPQHGAIPFTFAVMATFDIDE